MSKFGEFIRKKRKERKLRVPEISKECGRDEGWLYRIEEEEIYLPRQNVVPILAKVLEVPPEKLAQLYVQDWEERKGIKNCFARWFFTTVVKNGLLLDEIEEKSKVAESTTSSWINGQYLPSIRALDQVILMMKEDLGEGKRQLTLATYNINGLDHPNLFGNWLKQRRKQEGLRQKDVALGVSPTEVGQIERGVRNPRLSTALKIIQFFNGKNEAIKKVLIDRAARREMDILLKAPCLGSIKIALKRGEENLKQKELAKVLSIWPETISLLEYSSFSTKVRTGYLIKTIEHIAGYFGLDRKKLLDDFNPFLNRFQKRRNLEKELGEGRKKKIRDYDQEFKKREKGNKLYSGRKIFRKRIKKGLSLRDLAKATGGRLTHESINLLEKGEVLLEWSKVKALGKALNIDLMELRHLYKTEVKNIRGSGL